MRRDPDLGHSMRPMTDDGLNCLEDHFEAAVAEMWLINLGPGHL